MDIVPTSILEALWIRRTVGLSGYTLLVYDFFLTFDDEVKYVWRAPWSTVKVIFLLNRYGNLITQCIMQVEEAGALGNRTQKFCGDFQLYTVVLMLFSSESIHILVLFRAWAIWGCKQRVAAFLIGLYVTYMTLTLVMTVYGTSSSNFARFQYLKIIGICDGTIPPYVWLVWFASVVLDGIVFGLTMRSLRQHSHVCQHLYPSPLLRRLYRDACIFFFTSMFSNGFTILTWTLYSDDPKYMLSLTFSLPLLSVVGQRLVLNLRELKTHTFTTRDLSREVDRQILAFQGNEDPPYPRGDREDDPDTVEEVGEEGGVDIPVELVDINQRNLTSVFEHSDNHTYPGRPRTPDTES